MSKEAKRAPSLDTLIKKFSQQDVIAEMEKEYQSSPAKLVPLTLIDDNSYLGDVPVDSETVENLSANMKTKGIYNPLVVRRLGARYEVVLGRKRLFAGRKLGVISLPCVVLELKTEEMLLMILADVRDRKKENVMELAFICKALYDQFGYTHQTLANLSFQSRSQITNILRILNLPAQIKIQIAGNKISYGHAKALASLNKSKAVEVMKIVLDKNLSVRETEALVRQILGRENGSYQTKLASKVNANSVSVKGSSLIFNFKNESDLNSFIKKIEEDL